MLLRKKHVQALFTLLTTYKESMRDLRTLMEAFDGVFQALGQIVQPAGYKNSLLKCAVIKELDLPGDLAEFHRKRILESLPPLPLSKFKLPALRQSCHSIQSNLDAWCVIVWVARIAICYTNIPHCYSFLWRTGTRFWIQETLQKLILICSPSEGLPI